MWAPRISSEIGRGRFVRMLFSLRRAGARLSQGRLFEMSMYLNRLALALAWAALIDMIYDPLHRIWWHYPRRYRRLPAVQRSTLHPLPPPVHHALCIKDRHGRVVLQTEVMAITSHAVTTIEAGHSPAQDRLGVMENRPAFEKVSRR